MQLGSGEDGNTHLTDYAMTYRIPLLTLLIPSLITAETDVPRVFRPGASTSEIAPFLGMSIICDLGLRGSLRALAEPTPLYAMMPCATLHMLSNPMPSCCSLRWSRPQSQRMVAWRSRTWTGFSTAVKPRSSVAP